jgi:hypothetical protein
LVLAVSSFSQRKLLGVVSAPDGETIEEEILDLSLLLPDLSQRLPLLFADAALGTISKVLGESTGEALVRRIGDQYLGDPDQVYTGLDESLQGGAGFLKSAIQEDFRTKVHKLYLTAGPMNPAVEATTQN